MAAMAEEKPAVPVLLIASLLAGQERWLDAAEDCMREAFGPILLRGGDWPFNQTRYYEREMGPNLLRRLVAFERLIAQDSLAQIKRATNRLEDELQHEAGAGGRPVNIDPGSVSSWNVVLATMKPYGHRVCIDGGVYGEATLRYEGDSFVPFEWTYPSYRRAEPLAFLNEARAAYQRLQGAEATR
jgi:hypothetical protein